VDGVVTPVVIAGRSVGPGQPCLVIAEAGVNHNGDLGLARRLVEAAARAGADAIKFQTFSPAALATESAPKAAYQQSADADGESQLEMLKRLVLSREAHEVLMADCRERRLLFLSSPFEEGSADLLDELGVLAFKIPSGELTNLPLLAHIAAKGKPMIVSTGMATEDEVGAAVEAIRAAGNPRIILLHCTSAYPARPEDVNLRAMSTLASRFGCPVGYSDHTTGIEIALAAATLGACVLEKHFTLDRSLPGPDHRASVEPAELTAMVRGIRRVQAALGTGEKRPVAAESDTAAVARKSVVAARDIPAGAVLTEELLAIKRPGTGLPPAERPRVIGRRAARDIPAGTVITLEMLA
jgi:N,N'-diacetyllegionaminate synthase